MKKQDMRILTKKIANPNKFISIFSFFIVIMSIFGVCFFIRNNRQDINQYLLLGLLLFLIILIKQLFSDIYNIFYGANNIFCGTGQYGTKYDLINFIKSDTKQLYVIGQNIRTLLSNEDLKQKLKKFIEKNGTELTIILSPYKILEKVFPLAAEHLKQTVIDLRNLYFDLSEEQRKRFKIYFNPGTISLSAFIRDPADKNARGVIVFTPKWSFDSSPGNRMYCVIEKWENKNCFDNIFGGVGRMIQSDSLSLKDMCEQLNIEYNNK
jgi:hypothetical protein